MEQNGATAVAYGASSSIPISPPRPVYGGYENKSDFYLRPVLVQLVAPKQEEQSKKKGGGQKTEASSESQQSAITSQDDHDSAEDEVLTSEDTVWVRMLRWLLVMNGDTWR